MMWLLRRLPGLLCFFTVLGCTGLRPVEQGGEAAPASRGSTGPMESLTGAGPKPPGQIQQEVMDFSDRYVSALWAEIDTAFAADPDPARRVLVVVGLRDPARVDRRLRGSWP